ncbi:MAG: hypothetical protein PHF51_03305 [Candidatus ainarchaeum sp.]|nr:hypothetical protein [Candidatus ainarchaeum sp.]
MDYGYALFLIAGFAFIGAGMKYVDAAFDEGTVGKKSAYIVAALCGVLMGALIGMDAYAAMVLLSIILGVAVTGKIDAPAFVVGALAALAMPALFSSQVTLYTLPVAVLVLGAVIDELGNDLADSGRVKNGLFALFFRYRLTMEVFMAGLALAGFFPVVYLLALVSLDAGYHAMTYYSASLSAARARQGRGN